MRAAFRTIPIDEFGDRVLVRPLPAFRGQAIDYCRLRLFEIWKGKNSFRRFPFPSGLGILGGLLRRSVRMHKKFYPWPLPAIYPEPSLTLPFARSSRVIKN
jgi:hypothetical protein